MSLYSRSKNTKNKEFLFILNSLCIPCIVISSIYSLSTKKKMYKYDFKKNCKFIRLIQTSYKTIVFKKKILRMLQEKGKNIVVLCDGTWNSPNSRTNVYALYKELLERE